MYLRQLGLDLCHVRCLQAFRAAFELELNLVALVQVLIAVACNGLVVYEHIFATRTRNETEAFGSVEPLHCTLFHGTDPFFYTNPQPGGHGTYIEVVCLKKNRNQGLRCTKAAISVSATGLYKRTLAKLQKPNNGVLSFDGTNILRSKNNCKTNLFLRNILKPGAPATESITKIGMLSPLLGRREATIHV